VIEMRGFARKPAMAEMLIGVYQTAVFCRYTLSTRNAAAPRNHVAKPESGVADRSQDQT
jgi:hypothetical protein